MPFDTNRYTESPFLRGDDLEEGERMIVTIKSADEVDFPSGDRVPVLEFLEVEKKLTLNKTRVRKLVELLGDDTEDWTGQKIALYPVDVNFQGKITQGIAVAAPPKKKAGADKQKPEVKFQKDGGEEEEDEGPFA